MMMVIIVKNSKKNCLNQKMRIWLNIKYLQKIILHSLNQAI